MTIRDPKSIDNYFYFYEQPKVSESFVDIIRVSRFIANTATDKHRRLLTQWTC